MGEGRSNEIRPAWARSDRFLPRAVLRPLQEFLDTSTASGILLLSAVLVALVWANSRGPRPTTRSGRRRCCSKRVRSPWTSICVTP